jgi:hypothetical protein
VYNKNVYVIPAKRGKGYHAQLSIKIGLEASDQRKFTATALIDSGCTQSAINQSYIKEHNIPTTLLPFPLRVYNADGTQNKNGTIKRSVSMTVDLDGHRSVQEFFVTDLSGVQSRQRPKHHNNTCRGTRLYILGREPIAGELTKHNNTRDHPRPARLGHVGWKLPTA